MYNKIFTKILDSSIWLESDATRIVWLTMLASMDQDGFCQFASVSNLAHRAIVPKEAAEVAVSILEAPDKDSSDPDNAGRRIERVDGGWMVLNSSKYRDIVTASEGRKKTRERVQRFREKQNVTPCNAPVTVCNDSVTQSEAVSYAEALNPLPPFKNPTPSAEDKNSNQLDKYSAAKSLGELIGVGHSGGKGLSRLTSAIEQAERRWMDKNRIDVINGIVALWKEYCAQGLHAPVSILNWLDSVGSYIDSDHWRKPKKQEFKPQIDWQGGHVGPDGVYVNKSGQRIPGFTCPPKAKAAEA